MDYDFGYDFSEINRCKNFTEYDESNWDYFDDDDVDEYYEICNRHIMSDPYYEQNN